MRILVSCLVVLTSFAGAVPAAYSAKPNNPGKRTLERLVLMPIRVPDEDLSLVGSMETALVQGLQQKYVVFSGEQVAQKAKAIFLKESRILSKKECDETRCMQDIAIAFQAELIATANITKRDGGYFLALSVNNIFDNKVVYSNSVTCKSCDSFQVVEKLKELSGITDASNAGRNDLPLQTNAGSKSDPESSLWIEAQRGNTIDDYQVYLDNYPKGKYIHFANARIKKIKDAAEALVEEQQQQAWDKAQKVNTEVSFVDYLKAYPNGRFAGFAKLRLEKLKNENAVKGEEVEWRRAELSKEKTLIQAYVNRYPNGRFLVEANSILRIIKDEEAKGPFSMVKIPGKNYEIGKFEVTQAEWRKVMGNNPSRFIKCGDNCPVEGLSIKDIQLFIEKINARTGRKYRLPTEEEWEYACQGGGKNEYCGGNDVGDVAWYDKNSNATTHPVGQKKANGYGLYDMSGNIWEWVEGAVGGRPVFRGGSWDDSMSFVRSSYRVNSGLGVQTSGLDVGGFRLARTVAVSEVTPQVLKVEETAGPFKMVTIPGRNYEIGKFEVTQGEWQSVMGSNSSKFAKCGDNCPIENISWADVQVFIEKLNAKTGKQYRLPTEAEWEYACHAKGAHEYCGSDNVNSVGWYDKNSRGTIHPVGSKQANAFGLHDMSGNIWEWVIGEGSGAPMLRGGSWDDNSPDFLRASYRAIPRFSPQMNDVAGFRLARTIVTNTPAHQVIKVDAVTKDPFTMVSIPGRNYEIGKYEVTQGEWRSVMGNNSSKFTKCGDNCPIENISWTDVQVFIERLSAKTGKKYRLPTEAEWEYACHAGGTHEFCGDDNVDNVGWYDKNSGGTIHAVGSKHANAFGLHDMSGNIWEWVVGENSGAPILRGGSWDDNSSSFLRASYRAIPRFSPQMNDVAGFRLARTLP